MSTRERAYSIFTQLNEEQLNGFISMFGEFYAVKTETPKKSDKRVAYESLQKMIKHIPNLDEKKELEAYRDKRYGV